MVCIDVVVVVVVVDQVSHHPSISASHCKSSNFILWQGNTGIITTVRFLVKHSAVKLVSSCVLFFDVLHVAIIAYISFYLSLC